MIFDVYRVLCKCDATKYPVIVVDIHGYKNLIDLVELQFGSFDNPQRLTPILRIDGFFEEREKVGVENVDPF